jgi:tetratricopeptide (TPR) repeat protein
MRAVSFSHRRRGKGGILVRVDELATRRRALVIGSQCEALGAEHKLSFLPDLASELYVVLTDNRLGGCTAALPDNPNGGLLLDPNRTDVLQSLQVAFDCANRDGATLIVAMLGHGIVRHGDFFYLSYDALGTGDSERDVLLSGKLKHLLADSDDLNGLIVWLDTCHAGIAAQQATSEWGHVGLGEKLRRYELLTATDRNPAYKGDFTRTLIETIRRGVPRAGTTLDANDLREALHDGARNQRPQRVTIDGGGWAQHGDEGLWLAKNIAGFSLDDDAASVATRARVIELTSHLQPTGALDALARAAQSHRCVLLTGPRGSGKSTLAAALAQPAATDGHVPDGFFHAIAFATSTSTMDILASTLAGQLRTTVDGFARAVNMFNASLDRDERDELPALERRVMGPLRLMAQRDRLRFVIDAVDELPEPTQRILRAAVADDAMSSNTPVTFVLTARPGIAPLPRAYPVSISAPGDDVIRAYMRSRGVADEHLELLVGKAGGNWMHAYLLVEQAVRPEFEPSQLPGDLHPTLSALYSAELVSAGAADRDRWETKLRPVLEVLVAAGVGAVLPLPLAVAASSRIGGPRNVSRFLDSMVRLSGLTVRSRPGQMDERVGIFHLSLSEDYLLRGDLAADFAIDLVEGHGAIAGAIRELVPTGKHDPLRTKAQTQEEKNDPLYQYAVRAEADHCWGEHDLHGVVESLINRPLSNVSDQLERWQRWEPRLRSALGPEHVDALAARRYLAHATGVASDAAAARDLYEEIVPLHAKVLGSQHPEVLAARGNLADWRRKAGDPDTARNEYAELLPLLRDTLGPGHPNTIMTWFHLFDSAGEAGDLATAVDGYNQVLPLLEAAAPDDPITINAKANRAKWIGVAGDLYTARDQLTELIPLLEKVQGSDHLDTLAARSHRAGFAGQAGDPVFARDEFSQLLVLTEKFFGAEHAETLNVRAGVAKWSGATGDAHSARDQYSQLVPLMERVFGPRHRKTLETRRSLANWTGEAGDAREARRQYTDLVTAHANALGPEDPDTLGTRANSALWVGRAGDAVTARDQLTELVPLFVKILGGEHPDTLHCRAQRAEWVAEAGRPLGAFDEYSALAPLAEKVWGPVHPDTLKCMSRLAHWTGEAGKPRKARDLYRKLLKLESEVLGPEHADTLKTQGEVAKWTGKAGNPEAARAQYKKLLSILSRLFGPEHADTLACHANYAYWTGETGNWHAEIRMYSDLLPILERVFGPESHNVLNAKRSRADAHANMRDLRAACDQYQEIIPVLSRTLGYAHPDTIDARAKLASFASMLSASPTASIRPNRAERRRRK